MKIELEKFKTKLKGYKEKDIVFTTHAEIRALGRGIDLKEVRENIMDPSRLVYVNELNGKYDCYFNYSKLYSHKYVLTLNQKVIIITIININRDWQGMVK
jgi:hypothetical protein